MLPEDLLRLDVRGGRIVPRYLGARDAPWVQRLLDELGACGGCSRADVEARLARRKYDEGELARRALARVLLCGARFRIEAPVPPPEVRALVFGEAARALPGEPREAVLGRVGQALGLTLEEVERALYADLPEARVLEWAPGGSAHEVVALHNRMLLQGVLLCAEEVRVRAAAHLRSVVRFAKLMRLLCQVGRAADGAMEISLSGPLSVLRQTRKYGLALARFLPALCAVPGWRLWAKCIVRGRPGVLEASAADPIGGAHTAPRSFDSALEERLYRDLLRLRPDWRVEREPEPVEAGGLLWFPDFGITLPDGRHVLIEVVGFWTPEYLRAKARAVEALRGRPFVLCVAEELAVGETAVGAEQVLRFRRRVDARALCDVVMQVATPVLTLGRPEAPAGPRPPGRSASPGARTRRGSRATSPPRGSRR